MREPFPVGISWTHILVLSLVALPTGRAMGGVATTAVLNGNKVRVETDLVDGHLRERYLAKTDEDAWVEVATSDGVSGGPICLDGIRSSPQGNLPQ